MKIENINYIKDYAANTEYPEIGSVCTSAEEIVRESLFIFTKLANGERRPFPSFKQLPAVIVCEHDDAYGFDHSHIICVDNARRALSFAYAAQLAPEMNKMTFLGVTGTNGKTTTAYALYTVLSDSGKRAAFIGSGMMEIMGVKVSDSRYSMTTPDPEKLYGIIAEAQKMRVEYIVMEVSSHAIALDKLAPIRFRCGIYTNLSEEHMDFHKTMEDYLEVKLRFSRFCDTVIINNDDLQFRSSLERVSGKIVTVGAVYDGDIRLHTVRDNGFEGFSYIYSTQNYSFRVNSPLVGIYNLYNTALAIACAAEIGLKPCIIKKAVNGFNGVKGRFEIINGDIRVIIDYAHTPYALESFLSSVRRCLSPGEKLICIFGCGGERDKKKRPKMANVAGLISDYVIVTDDNPRNEDPKSIIDDIISGFTDLERVSVIQDRDRAIRTAITEAHKGDTVVIIGKGAEEYSIDREGYRYFNERDIIRDALSRKKGSKQ